MHKLNTNRQSKVRSLKHSGTTRNNLEAPENGGTKILKLGLK